MPVMEGKCVLFKAFGGVDATAESSSLVIETAAAPAPFTTMRTSSSFFPTTFPNQINNVLAFPGIFRGALDARARDINNAMCFFTV